MNPFGISDRSYNIILELVREYAAIENVLVYGSRAKGNQRSGSDIDLALVGNDLSPKIALEIAAILNEKLPIPYHVDVLHYDSITNPELKNHIDRVGKSFFE